MFTENEERIIKELLEKSSFSARMEDELRQCFKYAKVRGCDMRSVPFDFSQEKINKVQSKKLLEVIRKWSVESDSACDSACGSSVKSTTSPEPRTIYVEESLSEDNEVLRNVRAIYKNCNEVPIHHYKDVFNEKGHDFLLDKRNGDIVIAENHDTLMYPGAPFCQSFGNEHFYYTSLVKNCIYNCGYCYLSGMYPRGITVIFTNISDYFKELERILAEHPVYLCVSYDTDLLALEPMLHYVEKWVDFARRHPGLKIEVRTKSGNAGIFDVIKEKAGICDNVIFAWTLSPEEVIAKHEKNMPGLSARLAAVKACKKAGFPVRLCFDPMIYHKGWEESYGRLFKKVFEEIPAEDILDVSVGVFRISNNFLRRMRNVWGDTEITAFPYVTENGACHYGDITHDMVEMATGEIGKYYPCDRIYTWEGK